MRTVLIMMQSPAIDIISLKRKKRTFPAAKKPADMKQAKKADAKKQAKKPLPPKKQQRSKPFSFTTNDVLTARYMLKKTNLTF